MYSTPTLEKLCVKASMCACTMARYSFRSESGTTGTCSLDTGHVTCTLADLAANDSATAQLVVKRTTGGTVALTATVTQTETDPATANNSASESTTVNDTNLGLTIAESADPVVAGDTVVYTLTAANTGPADATGVLITADVPSGAERFRLLLVELVRLGDDGGSTDDGRLRIVLRRAGAGQRSDPDQHGRQPDGRPSPHHHSPHMLVRER